MTPWSRAASRTSSRKRSSSRSRSRAGSPVESAALSWPRRGRSRRGSPRGRGVRRPGGRRFARGRAAEGEVLAEVAHLLDQIAQALAQTGRPVATGDVVLHLLLHLPDDALHLLLRLVLRLLGLTPGTLGLLTGAPALVLGAPGLLLPLLLGAAHLLLRGAPGILVAEHREVAEVAGHALLAARGVPARDWRARPAAARISRRRSPAAPLTSALISAASSATDSRISSSRSASSPLRSASSARPASVIEYTLRPPSVVWVTSPSASSLARRG